MQCPQRLAICGISRPHSGNFFSQGSNSLTLLINLTKQKIAKAIRKKSMIGTCQQYETNLTFF